MLFLPFSRLTQRIAQLVRTISQIPLTDPAADADVDVEQVLGQIRSRYKALCARLGVRPTLHTAANSILEESRGDDIHEEQAQSTSLRRGKVWELRSGLKADAADDLSF